MQSTAETTTVSHDSTPWEIHVSVDDSTDDKLLHTTTSDTNNNNWTQEYDADAALSFVQEHGCGSVLYKWSLWTICVILNWMLATIGSVYWACVCLVVVWRLPRNHSSIAVASGRAFLVGLGSYTACLLLLSVLGTLALVRHQQQQQHYYNYWLIKSTQWLSAGMALYLAIVALAAWVYVLVFESSSSSSLHSWLEQHVLFAKWLLEHHFLVAHSLPLLLFCASLGHGLQYCLWQWYLCQRYEQDPSLTEPLLWQHDDNNNMTTLSIQQEWASRSQDDPLWWSREPDESELPNATTTTTNKNTDHWANDDDHPLPEMV